MPLLPITDIQTIMKVSGMSRAPATNSRMVRPREMRARNSPTKGVQAIHQPQKKMVHHIFHSLASSPAKA